MNLHKKYLLLFAILLFSFFFSDAQECEDSLQLYGFYSPDYTFNNGSNTFASLKGGYNCYLIYSSDINTLFNDEVICITDSTGRFVRAKKLSLATQDNFALTRICEAADGGIILLGQSFLTNSYSHSTSTLLLKLDRNLNIIWSIRLKPDFSPLNYGNYYMNGIHCDENGNIFFSFVYTETVEASQKNLFFIAVNKDGVLQWSRAVDYHFLWSYDWDHLPNVFSTGNKVIFLGQTNGDTLINNKVVSRNGLVGLSFTKNNGSFLKCSKIYIPNQLPNNSFASITDFSSRFNYGTDFYYGFGEFIDRNNQYAYNLITLKLDTAFNYSRVRRIKGYTSSMNYAGFCFNKNNSIAFTDINTNIISVVDTANNILLSRNIGNSFFNQPFIRRIHYINNENTVSVSVTDRNANNGVMQVDIPLGSHTDSRDCLGKDSVFFSFDTVGLVKENLYPDTIYSDIIRTQNIDFQAANFTLQEIAYCKTKSVCSSIKISGDTSFCFPATKTFRIQKNIECLKNTQWNSDSIPASLLSKTDTTATFFFNKEWKGYIKATLINCSLADSFYIEVHKQIQALNLGNDTVLCSGESSFLLHAGSDFKKYQWQDGSTDSLYIVSQPGLYYVTTEDYCGNTYTDTINIKNLNLKLSVGDDTSICKSDTITLMASSGFQNYTWSPAYNTSSIFGKEISVFPENTTEYVVTAEKFPGCDFKDTILVTVKDCPQYFYVPSAFSPNNDGKNDLFKPIISGALKSYEFVIYNRWGQVVFRTKNKSEVWNGSLTGQSQDGGIFVWVCRYTFYNQSEQTKKGTVLLIR